MKLRDRMIYAGLVTSDLKRRHRKAHIREFYRDLLHVCDDYGRFEADPALLRAVLYAPILDRVSERDVQGYLLELAGQRDIKLYTVRGRGYGKVTKWRQTRLRTLTADYPDETADEELPFMAGPLPEPDDPPPRPAPILIQKEGRKEEAPPAPKNETDEEWLARLARQHPHTDIRAELAKAAAKKPGIGRKFFEDHWLPNCEQPIQIQTAAGATITIEPEPEAWKMYLKDRYENESWAISAAAYTWTTMPAHWRSKITREMKEAS